MRICTETKRQRIRSLLTFPMSAWPPLVHMHVLNTDNLRATVSQTP
jgi:hypothetical protein